MVAHVALKSGSVMVRPAVPAIARRNYFCRGPIDRNAAFGRPARVAMVANDLNNGVVARSGTMDWADDDGMNGVDEMM